MYPFTKQVFTAGFVLLLAACNSHYPEGMSRAQRQKYYHDYNKAYREKSVTASAERADTVLSAKAVAKEPVEVNTSVPFSIKNNSLLPQKIEIAGNILDFHPLGLRYVGFPSGTKAYLYDKDAPDGRGRFLFEVNEKIRSERIKLFN